MKIFKTLFFSFLSGMVISNAVAQNEDHFYGGISGGIGRARIADDRIRNQLIYGGATSTNIVDERNDSAYKIFAGYQFSPYLGLEAGYFKLGEFGFKSTTIPSGSLDGRIKLEGINLDLVGSLPVNDRFSIIGRLGVDNTRARDTFTNSGSVVISNATPQTTDQNYKAGLGFSFRLNPSISLRGEFERYRINDAVGNKGDINVATVSLIFPFGQNKPSEPKVVERVVYEVAPVVVVVTEDKPEPPERIVFQEIPVLLTPVPEHMHVSFNSDILFGFDRAIISPFGKIELDKFINELQGVDYDNVTIVGHTDRIGTKPYNDKLSLQRADAVKTYFIARNVILLSKITSVGRGSSEPITDVGACKGLHSSVDAIACLSADRRVEVDVIGIKLINK